MSQTEEKPAKQDITLMTLLANEATGPSRRLLKKYNRPDATNYEDLETKLAELYYAVPDKIAIEKQLADIHPHKAWILRNTSQLMPTIDTVKILATDKELERRLNDAEQNVITYSSPASSSFSGKERREMNQQNNNDHEPMTKISDYIGLVMVVGLMTGLMIVLYNSSKKI